MNTKDTYVLMRSTHTYCLCLLALVTNSFEIAWNSDKEHTAKLVVNWNGKISTNTMMSQSNCFLTDKMIHSSFHEEATNSYILCI